MAYGTVKVDNVTFTYNAIDATTTFSGFYASTTNNLTLSGTASAATFTGTTANFTNTNAQNISVTTLLSGLAITGGTAGFTIVTGTTVTGTTANFVTVSGTTVTGTTAQFTSITGGTAGFTTITGTTVTGTTANFVTVSGTTVTGTTASFTSGIFTSLSGTTHTITSGVFALGTAALPSISFVSDPNTGIYSPGADQVAVATNGTTRLFVDANGSIGVGTSSPTSYGAGITTESLNGSAGSITDFYFNGVRQGLVGTFASNEMLIDTAGAAIPLKLLTNSAERARIRADGTFEIKGAGTAGSSPGFSVNPSTPANSFVIDSSGRLGIGISSPSQSLQVVGAIASTGQAPALTSSSTFFDYIVALNTARFAAVGNTTGTAAPIYFSQYSSDGSVGRDAVVIDSTGRVGIGTTGPSATLHVNGTTFANSTADGIALLETGTSGSAVNQYMILSHSPGAGAYSYTSLKFGTTEFLGAGENLSSYAGAVKINAPNSSVGYVQFLIGTAEKARIDNSGRLLVGTITQVGNANGGILQLGSGITFPATPVAATDVNTLDDYEEGTWAATITPQTSGTITLSADTGHYVKIGKQVVINSKLTVSAVSTPLGHVKISLPFTSGASIQGSCLIIMENTTSTGCANFWSIVPASSNSLEVYVAGGVNPLTTSAPQFQAGSTVWLTATYFV